MVAIVYLDPSVFVCPTQSDSIGEHVSKIEQYVETLGSLRDRLRSTIVQLLISRDTATLLSIANCYPVFPSLREGLQRAGLDEVYQPGDVVRLVDQLLREAHPLEAYVGVTAAIADPLAVVTPYEYVGDGPARELQDVQYLTLAIGLHLRALLPELLWIVGRLNRVVVVPEGGSAVLKISGEIQDIELTAPAANIPVPFVAEAAISGGTSCKQFFDGIDLHRLSDDLTEDSLAEIITLALSQANTQESHSWMIGPKFFGCVAGLNLQRNPANFRSLLAACVCTIGGTEMGKAHALRTGVGGGNPQIRKDGAAAWRRDVDRGFHLHYWVRGESLEFGSCVVHDDFSIPDPR